MKNLTIALLVLFLSSCASREISKQREDEITTDMAAFNQKTRGYLKRSKTDIASINTEKYMKLVTTLNEPSEADYVEFIADKDAQVEIVGSKNNFVVCIKNEVFRIIICDKTTTAVAVDFISRDNKINIKEAAKRLNDSNE